MKKLLSVLFAAAMIFSLGACSSESSNNGGQTSTVNEPIEILDKVWNSYTDDERFPAAGGDFENSVMNGPGKFAITETDGLQYTLYVPEESLSLIDDAASLMHMMNANTFTCGVFHVADAKDVEKLSDAMKDNILNTQWMCGFPDVLILVQVENNYLVSAFGKTEQIETFKEKLLNEFSGSKVLAEENLNF